MTLEMIYGETGSGSRQAKILRIMARIATTVMFLACVLFIWHNSMENAEVSAGRSEEVTEVVNKILESLDQEPVTEHFVRKLAHFSEYGLEGVLTVLLFMAYCLKPTRRIWTIILTGLVIAIIDESIQFFSAGRAPGVGDVCIDMAGFICGMSLMIVIYLLAGRAAKIWLQKRNRQKRSVY